MEFTTYLFYNIVLILKWILIHEWEAMHKCGTTVPSPYHSLQEEQIIWKKVQALTNYITITYVPNP